MYFADESRDAKHRGLLIEAKDLVNGVSIVRAVSVEGVEYFHIELETHDVVIAEGAPSETFLDDDSRLRFHNADEYRLLYPEAVPGRLAQYCAPRLEDGYEVERVQRSIAARAKLHHAPTHYPRIKVYRRAADS
jgi:O-antigen biosynthesis protein